MSELGSGYSGIVISPALKNINNSGREIEFPENVTKVFYNKEYYNEGVRASNFASKILKDDPGIKFNTYKKSLKAMNLPIEIRRKYNLMNSRTIYAIRMPNLGINILEI